MAVIPPVPIIEAYYSPSCAPCRLELPVLAEFARQRGAQIRIVIVENEHRARAELKAASPLLVDTAIIGKGESPRAILRAAGDSDGMLPYARSLNSNGQVCATWRGRLTLAKARALVAACARMFTSQRSR